MIGEKPTIDNSEQPKPQESQEAKREAKERIRAAINPNQLQKLYGVFNHHVVDSSKTRVRVGKMDDKTVVDVDMYTPDGLRITEDHEGSFQRRVFVDDAGDLVLEKHNLELKPEVQGKGVGTKLYDDEEAFYSQLGIDKFVIEAAGEGRVVWAKEKFGYHFNQEFWNEVLANKEYWMKEGINVEELGNNPSAYPESFLSRYKVIPFEKRIQPPTPDA